ncbi:MAG TPA: UDP-glucose 4-epimerase GalE [Candidatus Glassbacteria bacterium]|nr:UDP-glucose 4-epimerase GalE [Candidatus Glassbacteria bacterium]
MKVLLTGGAGYIGSHANKLLAGRGHETVVLDNLQRGHASAVRWGRLIKADLLDYATLHSIFAAEKFEAVMHFAALIFVGESVKEPQAYYQNNVTGSLNLLAAMVEHGVKNLIFSSTAAVYGTPVEIPIGEGHPLAPINPYGWSKLMAERFIGDYAAAYGMRAIVFRYFNAAGADPECETGENHDPENHLIPLVLKAVRDPRRSVKVFGTDYATPDGTCIRDFIHVLDLAEIHRLGLECLADGPSGEPVKYYNVGNGEGFSVREVIRTAERVTGVEPRVEYAGRRPGDAMTLVASSDKLRRELGWQPRYPELEAIIRHAWSWEQKLPGEK